MIAFIEVQFDPCPCFAEQTSWVAALGRLRSLVSRKPCSILLWPVSTLVTLITSADADGQLLRHRWCLLGG